MNVYVPIASAESLAPNSTCLNDRAAAVTSTSPLQYTMKRSGMKVVVVGGAGTIGSSTALHLVRAGYTPSNITVLDIYPFPSAQSAGNDLNKIMGVRLRNNVDLQLSLEARALWTRDDLFKPFFHNTGRVCFALCIWSPFAC